MIILSYALRYHMPQLPTTTSTANPCLSFSAGTRGRKEDNEEKEEEAEVVGSCGI
jgi:hypothetical protein